MGAVDVGTAGDHPEVAGQFVVQVRFGGKRHVDGPHAAADGSLHGNGDVHPSDPFPRGVGRCEGAVAVVGEVREAARYR